MQPLLCFLLFHSTLAEMPGFQHEKEADAGPNSKTLRTSASAIFMD